MNTARPAVWTPAVPQRGELSNVELANVRLLGEARLILAGAAMLLAVFEPLNMDRVAILVLLAVYAGMGYTELRRLKSVGRDPFSMNHWVDVAFYMPAVALSGGLMSDFAIFLLFPVFSACLRTGVQRGIAVGIVCVAMLAGIAWMTTRLPTAAFIAELPFASFTLLLVIAIVIARWAHTEITIARRLAFCTDVSKVFSPQHDLRRAVSEFCEMLRAYQQADACLVLLRDTRSAGWLLFQVDASSNAVRGKALDAAVVQPLLASLGDTAVCYRCSGLLSDTPSCRRYDPATLKMDAAVDVGPVTELAQLLEAKSLVSLPLQSRNRTIGRMHLT